MFNVAPADCSFPFSSGIMRNREAALRGGGDQINKRTGNPDNDD